MSRARECDFHWGPFGGGLTFFPYQLAFGVSLRYWASIYAPALRVYAGPLKLWLYCSFRRTADQPTETP